MRTPGPDVAALVWRAVFRPRLRNPREALLSLLSVALGVAVFLAVSIANRGAAGSFRVAFEMVTGRADLEIRGHVPEGILRAVRSVDGVAAATPLVEGMATLPDFPGESLRMVGIDPFTAGDLLALDPGNAFAGSPQEWLGNDTSVTVTAEFARNHALAEGAAFRVQGPGAVRTLTVGAILPENGVGSGAAAIAAFDIAPAQEWIGRPGELSAILIRLRNPSDRDRVAAELRAISPRNVTVDPPAARTGRVDRMLAAFRLNLTALSLVSLMVGMFFVGNAAAAAVVRKRVGFGILRALGTDGRTIAALVLADAALTGAAGSLAGILASPLLAGVLSVPVARTVSALYLPADPHGGWPTMTEALAGFTAGLLTALVAAAIPARQAASVEPVRVLHPGAAPEIFPVRILPLATLGLVVLTGSVASSLAALGGLSPLLGFLAAFLVLAGWALLVPLAMTGVAAVARRAATPVLCRIALDQALRSLHRTAPTVAALAAAGAMTVGIGVMIHSFRLCVEEWAGRTLTADLFIAPAANELLGLEHTLTPPMAAWWRGRTGEGSVGTFREYEATATNGEQVTLGAVSGGARGEIDFLHGDGRTKSALVEQGRGVALSESLARRLALGPGSSLDLCGPGGPVSLPVIDIYRDYTRDRGIALVGAGLLADRWGAKDMHSLSITFRKDLPREKREELTRDFCRTFGGREAFLIYDNRSLKRRILEIFNQTFAVTAVLKAISVAVAVGGVVFTLGMLVMERSREIGVLRAIGCSRAQIRAITMTEAGIIGLCAGTVGLAAGAGLAVVLTRVINTVFFGWTIRLVWPWDELLLLPFWMTAVSLAAGWVPATRAASVPPAEAVRME